MLRQQMLSLNRPIVRPTNNALVSSSRIELNLRGPPALGVIDEIEEESDESHSLYEVDDEVSNR